MSPEPHRHVYIDTQYVHAFIFPDSGRRNDDEFIAKEQFNAILHNSDQFILKIPFVVVGETINNIHRRPLSNTEKDDIIRKLLNIMSVDKVDMSPPNSDCFRLTDRLLREDNNLDNTDTLIVAQALCDPNSTHLVIKDGAVINSPAIQAINTELTDDGLRPNSLTITPEYIRL